MSSSGLGLAQGFMQGYGFMDDLDRRERRMGLQEAQNDRAERQEGRQRQEFNWDVQDRENQEQLRLNNAMIEAAKTGQFDPEIVDAWEKGAGKNLSRYLDPAFGDSLDKVEAPLKGAGSIRDPSFIDGFNDIFGSEINRNNGETSPEGWSVRKKRAAGVYPVKGGNIAIDLEVEEEDASGQTRRRNAPLTTNRSINDEDVKTVPVGAAVDQLAGHRLMYNTVQRSPELQAMLRQRQLRLGGKLPEPEKRYGEPFQHETLGMVQAGPDGQLHQLDTPKGPTISSTVERTDGVYNIMSDGSVLPAKGIPGKPTKAPTVEETFDRPDGIYALLSDGSTQKLDVPGQPAGSSNKAPADVRTANWLVESGVAADVSSAWSMVNESKRDPARFVTDFVTQELKAQEDAGLYPGVEGYRTTEELREQALEALRMIRQQTRGVAPEAPAQAGPDSLQLLNGQRSAPAPAARQPDGSYTGRIDRSGSAPAQANQPSQSAPPGAIEHLRRNPQLAGQFQAKYGYLPEGF